jgi:hypothetical protein
MRISIRQDQVCQEVTVVGYVFDENLPTFRLNVVASFSTSSIQKTEAVRSFEALINFNVGARCRIAAIFIFLT